MRSTSKSCYICFQPLQLFPVREPLKWQSFWVCIQERSGESRHYPSQTSSPSETYFLSRILPTAFEITRSPSDTQPTPSLTQPPPCHSGLLTMSVVSFCTSWPTWLLVSLTSMTWQARWVLRSPKMLSGMANHFHMIV